MTHAVENATLALATHRFAEHAQPRPSEMVK
jgi:hypothetical protein